MQRAAWFHSLAGAWCWRVLVVLALVSAVFSVSKPPPRADATSAGLAIGIGTNGIDRGFGIGTDAAGNIYATGSYGTTADFDPGPGVTSFTAVGSDDVWVAKYTPAGALVWVRSFGAGSVDNPTGLVVDATGAYVSGFFSGTVNFGLGDLHSAGNSDAFVVKLDLATGNTVWAQRFGGANRLFVTGRFQGNAFFSSFR